MVSLNDIARSLDVSVSLVSKVLNGRLGTTFVRPELARAIHSRAVKLGYRKNASAVALLQGRHQAFGVFIHQVGTAGSGIIEELLGGIATAAAARHQRLNLGFFGTARAGRALLKDVHRGVMDGLLIGGFWHDELKADLLGIAKSGIPIVTIYEAAVDPSLPNVGVDQTQVSRLATEHLIARGCRRIAHIQNMEARYLGYLTALRAHGLCESKELVFDAHRLGYAHAVGEQAVMEFIQRGIAFDGIVAQSDQEAMGCLNALERAGRRVPEDVRVIGVDNAPYCAFARVPLSSVSQNSRLRGQRAAELLLRTVSGRNVRSTTVKPELVVRDSTR